MISAEAYAVAWALFHARASADDAAADEIEKAWKDNDLRNFWLEQAQIALDALELHRREVA